MVPIIGTFLIGMELIIFNFAILPIGVGIMNLDFAILPIGVRIANPKFASCRGASEMDEVSKMELLKFWAFQSEKDEQFKMDLLKF